MKKNCQQTVRFRDGADSTDVTFTSSVLTSNERQSLLDKTNSVEANDICSLCNVSNNRKRGLLCSLSVPSHLCSSRKG